MKTIATVAGIVLLVTVTAATTYLLTRNPVASRPAAPAPTSTSAATVGDPESAIIREILAVKSVVERYIRAVTARDEAAATALTCRKTGGGMLWVASVGRPITMLRTTAIDLEPLPPNTPSVVVAIQTQGRPEVKLVLTKIGDTWCVWT